MQRQKNIPAAVIAAVALLVVNGCLGQEEDTQTVDLGLTRAMVDEEGNPWWDPSANTSVQYHEGDITFITEFDVDSGREKRGAIRNRFFLWTNAIIPFTISSSFSASERTTIIESMKHWEDNTCLRFVPRSGQGDHVNFFRGNGCSSYIGRVRGQQGISLGTNCVVPSVVIHEIGHAIGFFHEQSRPDRDDYVRIITANIQPGAESQFRKQTESSINSLGVGYDYNSVMHYDPNTFARRGTVAIVALDPDIPVGNAEELSPLDILQTNLLYRCSEIGNRPSQLVLPSTPPLGLPTGIQCGRVFTGTSGSFTSPGHPSFSHNQRCAWVISAPEGYEVSIRIRGLSVDQSQGCTRDYIQIHRGRTMGNPIRYFGYTDGRICDRLSNFQTITFPSSSNEVVVYYQTDGSNSQSNLRGFQGSFEARDINECRFSGCDNCVNTDGSFQCSCNDGFYLSPAAQRCFDVNECALENGGCEHTCTNRAGSYRCGCNQGFILQADGRSCRRPGDEIPTTPATPAPTLPPPSCGGRLTTPSGFLQSPNWPQTYPLNFECEWTIELPDPNSRIRLSFNDQAFGLAGQISSCTKDILIIYDGLGNTAIRTLCDILIPNDVITTSNTARVKFIAGPGHGPARLGFRITYNTIASPTTQPPTTRPTTATTQPPTTRPTTATTQPPTTRPTTATTQPPTQAGCGRRLTTVSGSLQSPNWPQTYPVDIECEWTIELPDPNSRIRLSFNDQAFGLAGQISSCTKDTLIIYDGLGNTEIRTLCDILIPNDIITTSNTARVKFIAGPAHGPARLGFRITYNTIALPTAQPPTTRPTTATTQPPTTRPTTATTQPPPTITILQTSSECQRFTTTDGSTVIKSPNWPQTYPVNLNCEWLITVSDPSKVIEISFNSHFGFAGRTDDNCPKDSVAIYDGHERNAARFGTFCEYNVPPRRRTTSNTAKITMTSLGSHGPARVGFQATLRIV